MAARYTDNHVNNTTDVRGVAKAVRKGMRHLLIAAALLLPLPLAAQEGAGPTITKSEIRVADPRRTHGRLRDVVWEMFEREDLRSDTPPRQLLRNIPLRTRPRGTEFLDLCRFDAVTVEVAPTSRRSRGGDTPTRAVGLRAESYFHWIRPLTDQERPVPDYDRLPSEGGCRSLDVRSLRAFRAPDANRAVDGSLLFLALQNVLRSASALSLECDLFPADGNDCRHVILAISPLDIEEITRCDAPVANQHCLRIVADDRWVDIFRNGGFGPDRDAIAGVRLTSFIVSEHEVPD